MKSLRTPRPSLYQEIADIIRDRIVEGILPAGGFVDESALAEELMKKCSAPIARPTSLRTSS